MKITIVSVGGTPTVHKAGCAHLNRLESTRGVRYDIEVGSAAEAASDFWTDLIAEGSMTEEEALSETRFAPCVSTLPTGGRVMTATLRRRYATSGSFVFEDAVPTAPHFRAAVPFLTLPDRVSVEYYCGDEPDVPTQVQGFTADLDPETNRGYVAASVSLTNRCEAYVTVRSVEPVLRFANGDTAHWERLTSCSQCGSRWAIHRQLAYGDEVDCPDCEHRSYFSIGD